MDTQTIYTSKKLVLPVVNPTHGTPGWRRTGPDSCEAMTYCVKVRNKLIPEWKIGWISTDEYRRQSARLKELRRAFERDNPIAVQEFVIAKRRFKKDPTGLLMKPKPVWVS